MLNYKNKKLNVPAYIATLVIVITLIIITFIIYKYHVEGEATPPFKISKINVVSTAQTENLQLQEGTYIADIVQNNDVRIAIEKNPDYKKEAIIKKVIINNIQIDSKGTKGDIEIYRPSEGAKLYEYQEQYKNY